MEHIRYESIAENITAMQDDRGLILTTDACLLSAAVGRNAKNTACELGAGSGIISMMLLADKKISSAVCVDFQKDICDIAMHNARQNGLIDKMNVVCADVLDYNTDKRFDVVVSNPPYFRQNDGYDNSRPQDKLTRHETTATIADFAACASRILKDGGDAYFCYTPARTADIIFACKSAGLEPKKLVIVYPTKDHKPSLILLSAKKGGKSGMEICRPLVIYKDKAGGELTDDYKTIKKENRIRL